MKTYGLYSLLLPLADENTIFNIDVSEKVVRNTIHLRDRMLVSDDIQASVHLHGVAIDDFAIELKGKVDCKLVLAVIVSASACRISLSTPWGENWDWKREGADLWFSSASCPDDTD